MTRSFSLGSALFENPIAPFLTTLARDYLDGADRVAVGQTCKAALQWFLQDWQSATLLLDVRPAAQELPERLLGRIQRNKQRLLLRGQHSTTVQLKQQQIMSDSDTGWIVTLNAVASTGKVCALSLTLQHLSAQSLIIVGQVLPSLTTLTLSHPEGLAGAFKLPPPSALPGLRHLTIRRVALGVQGSAWESVAPLMPQLVSLTIIDHDHHGIDPTTDPRRPTWHRGFKPQHTTQTLKSLSLPKPLEPWLAKLIQQHTPRYVESTTGESQTQASRARYHSWSYVTICFGAYVVDSPCVQSIPRQPGCTVLIRKVRDCMCVCVCACVSVCSSCRLNELAVAGIGADTADAGNVSAVCSWSTLRFSKEATVPASAWAWLPLPADGSKLVIDMTNSGKVTFDIPVSEEVSGPWLVLCVSAPIWPCLDTRRPIHLFTPVRMVAHTAALSDECHAPSAPLYHAAMQWPFGVCVCVCGCVCVRAYAGRNKAAAPVPVRLHHSQTVWRGHRSRRPAGCTA